MNKFSNKLHGVYAIADTSIINAKKILNAAEQAITAGCQVLQYRDKSNDHDKRFKQAQALAELCQHLACVFIVNDDIQLAINIGADGVHIGKHDISLQQARKLLGNHKIIGVSCYNSLQLAQQACAQGADYIAFGSFFRSSIKPNAVPANIELIQQAKKICKLPIAAIGGIHADNAETLIAQGVDMIAVISAVFGSDEIHQNAARLTALFS